MKRYFYLFLGTFTTCICGLMYNWTVFSSIVQQDLAVSNGAVTNVFAVCQMFFTIGGMISGFFYYKLNYKPAMLIASIMMGLGLYCTSRVTSIALIYVFYSFLFTISAGFIYKNLLTAVLTWFHDQPGLASGILLMGTGLTAFVFNVPSTLCIQKIGWRNTMIVIAIIAFTFSLISALFIAPKRERVNQIKTPNKIEEIDESKQISTGQMIKTKKFWIYFIWSTLMLAGCTAISGNAVNCGTSFGISPTLAATLTMIISLFNSISRVFYGMIYDKRGRKTTMLISTSLYVFSIILLFTAFTTKSTLILSVCYVLIGLTFGSVPTVSSIYILKTFGKKYYPSNFSVQGLYTLCSSFVGTMFFSFLYQQTHIYSFSYSFLIGYAIIIVILYKLLNMTLKKEGIE